MSKYIQRLNAKEVSCIIQFDSQLKQKKNTNINNCEVVDKVTKNIRCVWTLATVAVEILSVCIWVYGTMLRSSSVLSQGKTDRCVHSFICRYPIQHFRLYQRHFIISDQNLQERNKIIFSPQKNTDINNKHQYSVQRVNAEQPGRSQHKLSLRAVFFHPCSAFKHEETKAGTDASFFTHTRLGGPECNAAKKHGVFGVRVRPDQRSLCSSYCSLTLHIKQKPLWNKILRSLSEYSLRCMPRGYFHLHLLIC